MVNVGEGSEDCEFYIGERGLYDSARIAYRRSVSTNPAVVSAIHTVGSLISLYRKASLYAYNQTLHSRRKNEQGGDAAFFRTKRSRKAGMAERLGNGKVQQLWELPTGAR